MYNYRVFIYLYSQKTDKSSSADDNKKLMWQNYCTVIHYAFTNMHNQPIHTKYIHSDLVSPQFSLSYTNHVTTIIPRLFMPNAYLLLLYNCENIS